MNEAQTEKLMLSLGIKVAKRLHSEAGTNLLACCPIHGERHPSFAVHVEKGVYNCFACGESGTLVKLISELRGCSFGEAYSILEEFGSVDRKETSSISIRLYEEDSGGGDSPSKRGKNDISVFPYSKIAPFKSGKILIDYLLKRGFSEGIHELFKLGFNRVTNRITIPLFSRKSELWGWSERALYDKSDPEYFPLYGDYDKYLIHEFAKSHVLFPMNLFTLNDEKEAILVEGLLDAVWMHQFGYTNTLSIITANLNYGQIPLLRSLGIRKIVLFLDNDEAGEKGKRRAYKMLKDEFVLLDVVYEKKDPQCMNSEEIAEALSTKKLYSNIPRKLIRIK